MDDKKTEIDLDRVNTLPRVKSRENFLGLRRSIGRKEIASPKHIVPGRGEMRIICIGECN